MAPDARLVARKTTHIDSPSADHGTLVAHRVLDEVARIHKLLLVVLVELHDEARVDRVHEHLLKEVHEELDWEVATFGHIDRVSSELLVCLLVCQLCLDLNLEVLKRLPVSLNERDHFLLGNSIGASLVQLGVEVLQLLVVADLGDKLKTGAE